MTSHHNLPGSTTQHSPTTHHAATTAPGNTASPGTAPPRSAAAPHASAPPHLPATPHRPPARSALSARLALAGYGFGICIAGAGITGVAGAPSWIVGIFALLALAAVIDFVVVARRKRHGEPG